ncbi:MAG: DEAD/DEAH box helicase, partial [Abditibacteriota bacterium]|nr:DEAD/DEAH box helicase [Abditibacteriota bacterium]
KIRLDAGKINRVLWLCPCSVKRNLALDIRKHADVDAGVITICGIETLSGSVRTASELLADVKAHDAMIVVDESALVKNASALRTQRITLLASYCKYKVILNGTPLSNNEADLFSQWFLLDYRILGYHSWYTFARNHLVFDDKYPEKIRSVKNTDYLAARIAPYTFQIKKEECLQLPPKQCSPRYFDMTDEQSAHYEDVVDRFLELVQTSADTGSSAYISKLFTALQEVASGKRILSEAQETLRHEPFFADPEDNPRIQALLSVIEETGGEKAVIWCRYRLEIDEIMSALASHGWSAVRFDGSVNQKHRQENLSKFEDNARFLVANKTCAGFGLNLQYCRNAIYYSNDWSWGTRAQSEDRLHRIGQNQTVRLWDICANHTLDEQILDCLSRKGNLVDEFKKAIHKRNFADWLKGKPEKDLIDVGRE